MWLPKFLRKKESTLEIPKKEEPIEPTQTMPSTASMSSETSAIPSQLDRIETKLDSHDLYVRDSLPTKDNLKETSSQLLQQLQQLLQQLPTATSSVITAIAELNEGHRNIINLFLSQDYPDHYTFEEIGQRLNMPESSVRGYISALEKIGYKFDRVRMGKKLKVRLSDTIISQLLQQKQTAP